MISSKLSKIISGIFLSLLLLLTTSIPVIAKNDKLTIFVGQGCPHCAKVEEFVKKNDLEDYIEYKEIYHNRANAEEFNRYSERASIPLNSRGVPLLALSDTKYIIGDKPIIEYLQNNLVSTKNDNDTDSTNSQNNPNNSSQSKLTIPVVVGAALVDAINPCALAVLLILMTTALASGKRLSALLSGLLFTGAIFVSYLSMGLGLFHAFTTAKISGFVYSFIGYLAIVLGLFNLKDYFWYGKGFLMEVPVAWRPKLKKLIQSIASPLGALIIGLLISFFLLPCTSGPYIVIIGMLSKKELYSEAVRWLVLYNFIFVSPMLAITFGAYFGMNLKKAEKLRQKNLRNLHLIAGIILLAIGLLILFK